MRLLNKIFSSKITNDSNKEKSSAGGVDEIIAILKDFGLSEQDIIMTVKEKMDYSKKLINKGTVKEYIIAHYDCIYREPIANIILYKHGIAHDILKYNTGFSMDWKFSEETAFWNINKNLKKYGIETNFSPHEWNDKFKITLKKGSMAVYADFKYSMKIHDMKELIDAINKMLKTFGLVYLDADEGGDGYAFLLVDFERYNSLKKKYGKDLVKILVPWGNAWYWFTFRKDKKVRKIKRSDG